jgi:GGDEF domain-containing protein
MSSRVLSTPAKGDDPANEAHLGGTRDIHHETTLESREKLVAVREDAVLAREGASQAREGESNVREGAATQREAFIRTAEKTFEKGSLDHVQLLQQANANLIIASIEAHKLAEQVETSKIALDRLAHYDGLTELPNRMLLQDRLGQAIEGARRQGRRFAVLFMDLDRFKHINDSLGHGVGDQLLKSVAQRLVECIRQSDTVSRQGGMSSYCYYLRLNKPRTPRNRPRKSWRRWLCPTLSTVTICISASALALVSTRTMGRAWMRCFKAPIRPCITRKRVGAIISSSLSKT